MKVCTECNTKKELSEFGKHKKGKYGVNSKCKACRVEIGRKYRLNNPEKKKAAALKYYYNNTDKVNKYREENKEKLKKLTKRWVENNKERSNEIKLKWALNNKEKIKIKNKDYRDKNRDLINEKRRLKRYNNSLYRMSLNLRNRTWYAFRDSNWSKKSSNKELLGCDFETAHTHLEKQFTKGMSWNNYGEWHIDHIIPLASAKTEEELIKLFNYTNLQPLWAIDNLSKGAKIT